MQQLTFALVHRAAPILIPRHSLEHTSPCIRIKHNLRSPPLSHRRHHNFLVHSRRRRLDWTSIDDDETPPQQGDVPYVIDADKEAARVHFRTTFDFQRWAAHRSTRRYLRHVFGMTNSRVLQGLAGPLLFYAALSTAIGLGHELVDAEIIVFPAQLHHLFVLKSSEPLSLTSVVLGLLLVFRTNASYARWLDARKAWGLMINRSRDFARQGLTWLPNDTDEDHALRAMLCRWTIAVSYCLKSDMRENEDAPGELLKLGILPPEEGSALAAAHHRPGYALQVLSSIIHQLSAAQRPGVLIPPAVANMDLNLTQLEDVVGTCERILKSPIPLSYTRHTSRFLVLWLFLLPFVLWESCRWGTVPLTVLISMLTLGVEELGVTIEEPFGILPLEQFCATIKRNVEELQMLNVGANVVSAAELVNRVSRVKSAGSGVTK